MNQALAEAVKYGMGAIGGSGVVLAALVARKPRSVYDAEAQAAVASSQVSLAGAFRDLVTDLKEEIARKDTDLVNMRTDLRKLDKRVTVMQAFGGALLKHIDLQDSLIVSLGGTPLARPGLPELT